MAEVFVREFRTADRAAVRRICFETGSMGDPIAWQYADEASFADMLSAYYTDAEPEGAWVAELDGKVVGYMLSCLDSRKAWKPSEIALRHALTRSSGFVPARPPSTGAARSTWASTSFGEAVDRTSTSSATHRTRTTT